MIETLNTKSGYIYAYIDFHSTDKEGKLVSKGTDIVITGYWIHPMYRRITRKILPYFIRCIISHPECENMEYVYWERDDGRKRKYLASRFLKFINSDKLKAGA